MFQFHVARCICGPLPLVTVRLWFKLKTDLFVSFCHALQLSETRWMSLKSTKDEIWAPMFEWAPIDSAMPPQVATGTLDRSHSPFYLESGHLPLLIQLVVQRSHARGTERGVIFVSHFCTKWSVFVGYGNQMSPKPVNSLRTSENVDVHRSHFGSCDPTPPMV